MKMEKTEKLVASLYVKEECVIQIRNFKSLDHGLVLKEVHRVIKLDQKAWLKSYIYMNVELRKNAKNDFFKLMNNAVFGKTMEDMWNTEISNL